MLNKNNLPTVAYFSMEYGLSSTMKTYAGGLGILAGDYIKGVKDYGMDMAAVGIKWKQGYGDQKVGPDGRVYDIFSNNEYDFIKDTGIKVNVKINSKNIICKVWKVDCFNNIPLYLLDTDLPENDDYRRITEKLYGGGEEDRIAQEIVLGIGGVRALRELGIGAEVYHFNEGHAVFAGLELIREKMENNISFEKAFEITRKEIVFTTHTPVVEGNESHQVEKLMNMGANNGLTLENMMKIGGSPFNMTVAGLRLAHISNAVSELHNHTANSMWGLIDDRSQIIGITNAIHVPTWADENILKAAEGNGDLWEHHMKNKAELIEFIKSRTKTQLKQDILLIGFSRRIAAYKRNSLIMTDEKVVGPLLSEGKLQIVFSGKAHPSDGSGKKIIEDILKLSKKYPNSLVFLENYDMEIGKMLTRGCDVWLNNPRKPNEASGTSGMKAAMNGVLNLSTLDGWWPEVCQHGVNGWQFGDGFESVDSAKVDINDLNALYHVLQQEVIPLYYNNRSKWTEMMKNSILCTKDSFSMKRMVEEYYEKMYLL